MRRSLSIATAVLMFASLAGIATLGKVMADDKPDYTKVTPVDLEKQTQKGKVSNPYKDTQAYIVSQGESLFRRYSCSGCHGGTGGGGMCPPLTNDTWVYGGDDDTLFRLVSLGSDELQSKGYTRTGHENVVGPMPPMGAIVPTDDDLWHILAFVRSNYHGAPECKFGCPPEGAEPKNP